MIVRVFRLLPGLMAYSVLAVFDAFTHIQFPSPQRKTTSTSSPPCPPPLPLPVAPPLPTSRSSSSSTTPSTSAALADSSATMATPADAIANANHLPTEGTLTLSSSSFVSSGGDRALRRSITSTGIGIGIVVLPRLLFLLRLRSEPMTSFGIMSTCRPLSP